MNGLNFSRFVVQTVGVSLCGHVFSLLSSILVARTLGPAGKGVVAVVLLYPTFLFAVGHLSIYRVIVSHMGLSGYSILDFCGTLGFFLAAMSIFLLGIFWGCYLLFPSFFVQTVSPSVVGMGLLILPLFFINQLYGGILQTQEKITQFNRVAFAQSFSIFMVLIFMYASGGLTLFRVVLSYVIANAVAAGLAVWYVVHFFPGVWTLRWGLLRDLVIDSLKLHPGVIAILVFLKIDQLMLQHYRGAASVGFYSVSVSYADLLLLVPAAIQNVFYGKISRMLSEKIDLVPKTLLVYRHSFYLLVILSVFLAVSVYPVVLLFYGRSFLPSVAPFAVLLPGILFLYANNILTNYMVATKKFLVISATSVVAALFNIALNMLLIPVWDAVGAAFSSSLTYLLVGAVYIVVFMRLSRMSFEDFCLNLRLTGSDLSLYRETWQSIFRPKR